MGLNMEKTLSQRDYRILIGAAGWQHPEWANDAFYPDDLPEDWYLSFYANEFPIALLPDKQWDDAVKLEQVIDEITEQATPGFKCVFELDISGDKSAQQNIAQLNIAKRVERLTQITPFLSGLLVLVDVGVFNDEISCNEIVLLGAQFNVCLQLENADPESDLTHVMAFCEQHSISVCWKGEGEVIVPEASKLWMVRCESNRDNKPLMQQLKLLIAEQLKRETMSREHVLIIDGSPPKIEVLRNANIMIDIM